MMEQRTMVRCGGGRGPMPARKTKFQPPPALWGTRRPGQHPNWPQKFRYPTPQKHNAGMSVPRCRSLVRAAAPALFEAARCPVASAWLFWAVARPPIPTPAAETRSRGLGPVFVHVWGRGQRSNQGSNQSKPTSIFRLVSCCLLFRRRQEEAAARRTTPTHKQPVRRPSSE